MDGIDAAMVLTDGETVADFGRSHFLDTRLDGRGGPAALVARDWRAFRPPASENDRRTLAEAERTVVARHAEAAVNCLIGSMLDPDPATPAVIGFHGQTVAHAENEGWTWQLGDGAVLASALNRPVVWDFRTADMAAGGQGAPLAPFYHFALAKSIDAAEPLAFLNIGGVGNVTWVDPLKARPEENGALVAFDTGPGNALIDDWMNRMTGEPFDRDGSAAAQGRAHPDLLVTDRVRKHLRRAGPKSLDRHDFHDVLGRMNGLSVEDGAATLTSFTADCVVAAARHMPKPPSRWLVSGGGSGNPTMMRMLGERLDAPVDTVERVGLDGDMLEAEAFAYLAVRVLRGLPTSAPSTTGCGAPVCGGRIAHP